LRLGVFFKSGSLSLTLAASPGTAEKSNASNLVSFSYGPFYYGVVIFCEV